MNVLGLSFDFHDAAAALLVDDRIVFAAEEERFSRIKHDRRLPRLAVGEALAFAGLSPAQLDAVVFYEKPLVKFGRIVDAAGKGEGSDREIASSFAYWLRNGKFSVAERIAGELDIPQHRVHCQSHHHSHAASAYYCSGFDTATVVTIDGIGEYETASISIGQGNSVTQVEAMRCPDSIGLFYSAMTAFLGFEVNEGEYKVMGMAGFGTPRFADAIRPWLLDDAGAVRVDRRCFDFSPSAPCPFTPVLVAALGEARVAESAFDPHAESAVGEDSRRYADIAASVQRVAEEAIVGYVRHAVERTGIRAVAMAGGVALNSLANGRIRQELDVPLYVHPSPGDAGGALGAALSHRIDTLGLSRPAPLRSPFLGRDYGTEAILAALQKSGVRQFETFADAATLADHVSGLLADGQVLGWFQGRFEWGPRALGARSIIANPALRDMKRIINEKIKFREPFRPFAPAVLSEYAPEWFDTLPDDDPLAPENFMLSVRRVRPGRVAEIPAVVHVDGTARIQLVRPDSPSPLRTLLERFHARTGLPILLNISFNRRGEPMVASPDDALKTFYYSGLDALAIGNFLIRKH